MIYRDQGTPKGQDVTNHLVPHRRGAKLSATAIEVLIKDVLRLRNNAAEIGLPAAVTCLDYAYYEMLAALRESRDPHSTIRRPVLIDGASEPR